ncbi:MAG: FimV/HubP family polar landmark protein [Mariprofundaceae bacterium]|nr:FimV/HubP family polar landmark protein [Mariprofundaceae bacterium]
MTRKFLLVFYALTFFVTMGMGSAQAVSVGKIEVASHLGEPFYAEVPLLLENDEVVSNVSLDVAGSDDYRVLEVYRDPVLKQIKTWLKTDKRGTRVEINSNSNIETPFFNLVLKVRYNSATHFKKYVVFLELPTSSKTPRVADISQGQAPAATATPSAALTQTKKTIAAPATSQPPAPAMNTKSKAMKAVRQDASAVRAKGWARTARYGPMVRGDTVTTVAQRLRIDGTFTNAQVMIALFEKNKDKFGEGNINLIKAGTFLDIPSAKEVARYSPSQASKILVSQNVQWKKLVKKPKYADIAKAQRNRYRPHVRLGKAGTGVAAKPMTASKKNDPKTVVKQPTARAKLATKKAVVAPSSKGDQGHAAASMAVTKANEALTLENKQLKEKLAAMDSQKAASISAEKAALEARNKKLELQIVRLQAQLDSMKSNSSTTAVNQAVAKPATPVAAKPAAEVKAVVAPAAVKPVATLSAPAPAEAPIKTTPTAKPTEKPVPAASTPQKKPASTDDIENDEPSLVFGFPLLWVIGAIVLLLLIVLAVLFILLKKRNAGKAAAVAVAGSAMAGTAAMAAADDHADDSIGLNSDEFDASEMEASELLAMADISQPSADDASQSNEEDEFSGTIGGTRSKVNLPVEQIPALTDEDTSEFDAFVDKDESPSPDVDYLTEADVYLRYGMEDEAEEQVGMALKLNKSDVQAHVKMLQIRHAKGEQSGIDETVAQARSALSGDDLTNFEAEVGELGIDASGVKAAISSEKTLEIDEGTDASALDSSMSLSEMESTAEVDMGELKSGNNGLDFDIGDIDLGSVGTDAAMAAAASAGTSDDLDFDLGDIDLSSLNADSSSSESSAMPEADGDLDFDLGDMDLSSVSGSDDSSSAASAPMTESDGDLDFDLGDMDLSSVSGNDDSAHAAATESQADSLDALDFDFDSLDMSGLDDDDDSSLESTPIAATESTMSSSDDLGFDLSDMNLDDTSLDASDVLGDPSTDSSDDAIDFDFDMGDLSFDEEGSGNQGGDVNLNLGSNDLDDDLAMLDMSFDDVPASLDNDSIESQGDETIVTDFNAGLGSSDDDEFGSLDFISTVTMENSKQSGIPLDLGSDDIEHSLDSMSLMVDDITPALQSMETDSDDDDELTKTLSTMSMLVDDMDTSEISIDMDDDDDSDALDLSLSTGDLDLSLQTRSALDDDSDPDLTSLLGELEEITGLNDIPRKS